jgi:para-aminobenzoate synthetase component 1
MNFGPLKISSASPERFISVRDRAVETRPIKGTRPRMGDPAVDQLYRNELENSEKDRAENAMIVDLLRNDLSKVCEDHSVEVPALFALEDFASVHHLVSTVTGALRVDKTPADLLRACFPGGSITGCPKVRAMEIIEEQEPHRRGPYCGALGYLGFNGNMDTNIAIRTLVYTGDTVSFNTGSGIVADSDPAGEYEETFDKAESIFRSFEPQYREQAPEETEFPYQQENQA